MDVFHKGERHIQKKLGEEHIANLSSRLVLNCVVGNAVNFVENQSTIIISSQGIDGYVWTSFVVGQKGFVKVPQPGTLVINMSMLCCKRDDLLDQNIQSNHNIGCLFIDPVFGRRFRVNGTVDLEDCNLKVTVIEAYPNCPKYIQRRASVISPDFDIERPVIVKGRDIDEEGRACISGADTFFVGTIGSDGKLDASHRGGKKGFIQLLDNRTLKIPDYKGNSFYNTLGNISLHPFTGLLFIDFDTGGILQLTGNAGLLFDQRTESDLKETGGTGRYWLFETLSWIHTKSHHQIRWEFQSNSPYNP